jgi:hypothetical protein
MGEIEPSMDSESNEQLGEWVSSATYGTVLIIAALVVVDADDVASGWGWSLVTGVGVATWVAHLFAEVLGHHVRNPKFNRGHEVRMAMTDGFPILIAAVVPAVILGFGSVGVLEPRQALWFAVGAALLQLIGLGVFVGVVVPDDRSSSWRYAAMTAVLGTGVVILLVALGH